VQGKKVRGSKIKAEVGGNDFKNEIKKKLKSKLKTKHK